jgi:hypothetical protein
VSECGRRLQFRSLHTENWFRGVVWCMLSFHVSNRSGLTTRKRQGCVWLWKWQALLPGKIYGVSTISMWRSKRTQTASTGI